MWIIRNEKNPDVSYILCPGEKYDIGRVNVDIQIKDDQSVSRLHARFVVESKPDVIRFGSEVTFQDLGSSYGSYVGEEAIASSQSQDSSTGQPSQKDRLGKNQVVVLAPNTKIRVGLLSTIFRLEWKPLVVTCSTLRNSEKNLIKQTLTKLGGNLVSKENKFDEEWSDDVTHLAMNQVTLTIKVANALAKGVPIVNLSYFKDFLTCQQSKQILPDPKHYIPELCETGLVNVNDVTLAVKQERQKLFQGLTFAFVNEPQMAKFQQCIAYAGGKAVIFGSNDSQFQDPKIFESSSILLIQPDPPLKAGPTTPAKIRLRNLWNEAEVILASKKLRMIAVSSIGLALLHCSTRVHCNPEKQILIERKISNELQKTKNVLAADTQTLTPAKPVSEDGGERSFTCGNYSQTQYIPETLTPSSKRETENFVKPKMKDPRLFFGNVSAISLCSTTTKATSAKLETSQPCLTSTQAFSQASGPLFDVFDEDEDDFFAFCDDKKRKRIEGVATSKRPRVDNGTASKNVVSDNTNTTKKNDLKENVFDLQPTSSKKMRIEGSESHKSLARPEEDEDVFEAESVVEAIVKTETPKDELDSKRPRLAECVLPKEGVKSDGVTIVDEFGFIGKNVPFKKESAKPLVDDERSRSYSVIKTVPLVLEKSIQLLKIDKNQTDKTVRNSNSNNNNNVKRFHKQPLANGPFGHLISCKLQTEETFVAPKKENKIDDWLTKQRQVQVDEVERDELWEFSMSQSSKKLNRK